MTEAAQVELSRPSIKGEMIGVVATSWTMDETLTDIAWSPPNAMDAERQEVVRAALLGQANEPVTAGDSYFGGKQLAKIARLILFAKDLG
jgi:endo-1,3(4)-beta-glucanase